MGGGLREDEEQEGTYVSLSLSTVSTTSCLHLVPTPSLHTSSSAVVVCGWHPSGQLFASGDRSKKVVLWTS